MADVFNRESKGMRFLSALGTLIISNLLFIITSIPIITIGASITALYRITFELHMGRDPFVIKDYFRYFKEGFKKSTIVWCASLIISAICGINLYITLTALDASFSWLQYPIYVIFWIMVSIMFYAFPMIALYDHKLPFIIKNSILISLGNIPTTIFFTAIFVIIGLICDLNFSLAIIYLSYFLFIGFSFTSYFFGLFINRAFKIEKPKKEKLEED